jgi:predicted ATPase/DNA-binding CsgD family transcriptional regulator
MRRGSASDASNNLPQTLTSFVGRARELAELRALLPASRVLTITGSGGCGKSRLAAQAARAALEDFSDGAWWVELAPITDPSLIAPVLAQVFGVRPLPGQTELDAVVSYLAPRDALVLIDNCEHLLEAATGIVEALARGCPRLRVVSTSREPLRAEGETEWRVPSLSLLSDHAEGEPTDASDAVRLFVERAAQVRPGFRLTPDNAPTVAAICRDLDGIPLAIELAAARLRAFSLEQVTAGLSDRLRHLTGGTRSALPRHQTLRASVEWSHELLTDQERLTFRRAGVFVGGFSMEAAERVCSGEGIAADQVLGHIATLVEKSIVQAEEHGPAVRYRLLETMRQYALERLDGAGETEKVRDRHRDFYLDFAVNIEPGLLTPRQPEFLDRLDPEAANLAVAIERASATEPVKALQLCVALTFWWRLRSLFSQGEVGFARALDAATEPSELRARALWGRAYLLIFAGTFEAAFPAAQQALEAAEEIGDDSTTARVLWLLGIVRQWPDPIGCRPGLERARDLAASSGDDFALMHATQAIGMSYTMQDDYRRAKPFHEDALRIAERLGQREAIAWYWVATAIRAWFTGDMPTLRDAAENAEALALSVGDVVTESAGLLGKAAFDIETGRPRRALERGAAARDRALAKGGAFVLGAVDMGVGVAFAADGRLEEARSTLETLVGQAAGGWAYILAKAQTFLAEVARLQGDTERARTVAAEGFELAGRTGNAIVAAQVCLVLGRLAAERREWTEAQRMHHEALLVAVDRGWPRVPRVFEALAETAAGLESYAEAARLLGVAARSWSETDVVPWPHQRDEVTALESQVREALGVEASEQALEDGRAMTTEEAVAYVRRARGKRKRPSAGWESLTPTELEVARHAAAGMTNPEIAARMFISRDTVRTHLSHIFGKLALKNRSELAGEVARRGDLAQG